MGGWRSRLGAAGCAVHMAARACRFGPKMGHSFWATVFGPQFLVFGLVWATRRLEAAPTVLTTHAFSKHNQACRLAAGRPCMQGGAAGTHGRNGQLQAPSFGRAGAALPAAPRPPRLLHSAAAM